MHGAKEGGREGYRERVREREGGENEMESERNLRNRGRVGLMLKLDELL